MKYLFFISWFRAREKRLADKVDFDRMIGAKSLEESFKVLNDTDYAPHLSGESHNSIERVIEKERDDFRKTLSKMGMDKEVLDIIFLKDDLQLVSEEAKEKIFKEKEKTFTEKKKEEDVLKKIRGKNPQEPHEIDDIVLDIYFQKIISFLNRIKEKQAKNFFEKYWEKISGKDEDIRERDEILLEMENEIIEKSREEMSGIIPLLAFFIKKRRVECFIRNIFSGKRIGLDSKEIYSLISEKRAL